MNESAAEPPAPPLRTWRPMATWSALLAAGLLLAAWSAAHWKRFHLTYCKALMSSANPERQAKGLFALADRHLRPGMKRAEVARLLAPLEMEDRNIGYPSFSVTVRKTTARSPDGKEAIGDLWAVNLLFEDDVLQAWEKEAHGWLNIQPALDLGPRILPSTEESRREAEERAKKILEEVEKRKQRDPENPAPGSRDK